MSKGSSVEIQKKSEEVPLLQEQADPMQDFAFAELSETVQAAPVQTHARDESFVFVDLFEVFPAQSAARIEEELKTGPPKEVSKRQRKQWTLDKEEALRRAKVHEAALAKRRQEHLRRQAELREQRRLRDEAFYAPARAMTASVEEGIRDWRKTHPEESEGGFSTEYADELSRRLKAEDRTDFSALNVDEVPVLRELTDMLRTLLSTSPSAFSSEAAKAMNARYNALPLPAAAVNAQLDNAGAAQPQANHIFLLHAVALTLYGQTEGQTANPDLRASLYAIAAASGLAAGTVMADPAYRRTREEAVAQERSEQGRAEAATATAATIRGEAQRAEWRAYIRSGQATGAAPRTDWPIAAFEREIWAKAEAGDFDDFDTADFVRTMESFNQNLTENTGQCTRLIRARAAAFPMLLDADFAALIQKEMLAGFENDVWDRQLEQKRMEAAFETAKAGEVFVERSAALAARMDRLCPTEDLKILGGRLRTDGELIQKIIALDDAAFDEFAAELTDQMALNVEVMDGIFSETLRSPVARRLARETFMTDYGANVLLRGTVASVSAGASFFAQRLLSVQSPAAAQEESSLQKLLSEIMLPSAWMPLLEERLRSLDTGAGTDQAALRAALKDFKNRVTVNLAHSDGLMSARALTPEQWEELIEKRFRTLDAEPEAFKTEFLLLLDSFTAEASQNAVSYSAYIGASPKTKGAGGIASAERRNRSRFTDLFKGGALCDYADFGSLLSPHKDAILQALNDLLKSEAGKAALHAPGAENLASAEDLNVKMTKPQFDAFVRAIRRNIATNLETWTRYPSLEERLLPHLLKALTPEQFQAAAQKEQADVQRDEETQKLRFPVLLHGEARPAGPIVYDYTTAQANTAFGAKKELRAESRIRRFEQAAALRLMLRDASLYEAAMQVYRETQAQSKEKPEGFPGGFHTNLKSLVSARLDGETNGEEREKLRRLKEKLDAAKAEEYALEFGLSGYEDLVLSSSADMRTALVAEHREGYEGRLKFMERRIANRLSDLNKLFDLYPNAPLLRDVGREAVLANMREMIVSLGDSSAGAESALANENAKRYGVSSWAVARGELEKLLRGGADAGALLNAENVARCRDARIERLRKHDDGLFEEILPYLLRHEKSYRTLCTGSDDETDALIAALAPPLTILRERYGNRRFVARQLCLKHAEAILNAGGETNWAARFETTEKQLTEYSNGNIKSVSKRIQEITKGGKKAPLIMGVLARNDDLLFRSIGDVSEAILPQIEENLKSLNAFIEGQTEEFSPARKAGFQMYLNDDIVSLKNKDFSLRLGAALGEFTLREKADNLERARAETRMRAREVQRLEVDFEKVKARASAPPDDANALASLKNAMYGGLSPVMFRNAGTDGAMPTQEQLAQARKEFESAYGKSGGPTAEQKEEARKREADAFGSASAYDEEVNAMLLERALFTKGAQLAKPVATALDELARFMKAQKRLTWPGAAEEAQAKPADPQAIASFIQYMGLFGGTPEEDGKYSEKQIREHLAAFSEKQDLLNRLRLIAPKDPLLVSEHADDARAVSYAVYVLSPEAFRPLAENRIAYFTRAVVACRCIDEVLAEKGGEIRQDERTSLKIGLREYFGAALLGKDDDFNAEAFKNDVRAQLSDADRRQYLQDSSSLLGGVHFLSLRESERTMSAMKNREDFEDFLNKNAKGNRKNRSRLRAYNSLDLQQRAIFALSLSMPGAFRNTGAMRSTEMAEDAHERREAARETQLFLAAYVKQEAHDLPHADYSAVIANLFGQGETLYEAVFDNALAFTAQIVKRRNDAIPKDWERLADPMESVLRNKGAAIPEEGAIANKDAFMAALSETADGKKTIRANLTERLSRLSEAEFNLLIYLLQDRTALDWSTGVNAAARAHGTIHGAANSEKRASVKERYVFDPTAVPPADSSMLRRALLCLRSYQIRDDTDLTQRRVLRAGDFAKGALDRKTFADEALLENALSFLEELNQEYVRVQAIQRAPDLIEYGGNEDAKRLYRAKKGDVKSRESLETLLVEQAAEQAEGRDNTAQLMLAGYFALSDKQKVLFIKALGRRDILDVSKQDIGLNRFGLMDRDYANPRARDDLIDRYVAASEPLELTGTDCETAFESCLSAQVNDDASTEDILAALRGDADARGDVFTSTRKTAVDWKLFGRTVQFVRRAENERDVFLQDRELYRARGDVVQEGEFEFNAHYMRRNVHSAGNRFTRHLGRRTAERVKDAIPSPVNAAVRRLLGPEASNRINKMEVLQGEANEKGLKAVLETAVGYSAEIGETLETLSETPLVDRLVALAPEALTSGITEYTSLASTLVDTVNNVVDSVKAIKGKMNLNDAEKRGAAVQSLDEREAAKAALRQSAEQKTLSDAAAERNVLVTRLGIEKGRERTSDVLITATAELISAGIGLVDETNLTKVLQVVVEEAGELINLLRSYFNDKTSIGKFFENESALKSYGEALRAYFGIDSEKIDRVEMARLAMGFENYTETASYVGLNITRGLLFSAGRQNPVAESRILALAVLDVIGCADSAGKQDDETANEVYKALMGGKYR